MSCLVLSCLVLSCVNEGIDQNSFKKASELGVEEIISPLNENVSELLKLWYKRKHLINKSKDIGYKTQNQFPEEYDYQNPVTLKTEDGIAEFIIVNAKNGLVHSKEKYAEVFINTSNGLSFVFIVKIIDESPSVKIAEYYSKNHSLLFTLKFDYESESMEILSGGRADPTYNCEDSFAEQVLVCLDDIYRNQGWLSVWAFVQTAYNPTTAVALTALCVANVLDNGCYSDIPVEDNGVTTSNDKVNNCTNGSLLTAKLNYKDNRGNEQWVIFEKKSISYESKYDYNLSGYLPIKTYTLDLGFVGVDDGCRLRQRRDILVYPMDIVGNTINEYIVQDIDIDSNPSPR